MNALLELAERCEKATGPDYALGREILFACGWTEREYEEVGEEPGSVMVAPDGTVPQQYPQPTHSLDAAMPLVPEGWAVIVGAYPDARLPFARLFPPDFANSPLEHQESNDCASHALALCAAALRARAAQ